MRWLLAVVSVAGCGRLGFEAPAGSVDPTGDGGNRDGLGGGSGTDGASLGACVTPAESCAFPGGIPCTCWGNRQTINASMTETNGTLTLSPNANTAGAQAACLRNAVPFPAQGVFAEVSGVVTGAMSVTSLQVGANADVYQIEVLGTTLLAGDGGGTVGMLPYAPAAMRWWRVRPDGAGGVVYEYGADGKAYTSFATSTRPPGTSYTVKITGATLAGVAAPGSAAFEGVNVCPP